MRGNYYTTLGEVEVRVHYEIWHGEVILEEIESISNDIYDLLTNEQIEDLTAQAMEHSYNI